MKIKFCSRRDDSVLFTINLDIFNRGKYRIRRDSYSDFVLERRYLFFFWRRIYDSYLKNKDGFISCKKRYDDIVESGIKDVTYLRGNT